MVTEGELLWTPSTEVIEQSNVVAFMHWLEDNKDLSFSDYDALWQWSVDSLEDFWQCMWEYFEVESPTAYTAVLEERVMPGAKWFPGAKVNFIREIMRRSRPGETAIQYLSEISPLRSISWDELASSVRILAGSLVKMGVKPGDRVAAYIPNTPESTIGLFACVSIGAVWSSCSPDFGTKSVLDRFQQLEPKVLIAFDGYRYGGRDFDRRSDIAEIMADLPSVEHLIYKPYLYPDEHHLPDAKGVAWDELLRADDPGVAAFEFEFFEFDHPAWIVFSSGTTGLPKALVHNHGGLILEGLKFSFFNLNLKPSGRLFSFTTTGWIVWNSLVTSLIAGSSIVQFDGNPTHPRLDELWRIAADTGATIFATSSAFVQTMINKNIVPGENFDFSRLESVFVTGSPMAPESMSWVYDNVKQDLWVASQSGGTDIASAFVVGVVSQPVYAGEIQARGLGCDVHAFDDAGNAVIEQVGELVCVKPMPSMPIYFWNDEGGQRYLDSYFADYPGIWRHGDFLKINKRGGCYIYGRSDSTLNRAGVRIGTAEVYRSVETLDEVDDSMVLDLELKVGKSFMPLFVVLAGELKLDQPLKDKIKAKLRADYSPRHVPDSIYQVDAIPYTLTGKKMEVPVRKILLGLEVEKAANPEAMANPGSLAYFVDFAKELLV
jgi:acetoacetyl-CoA synthetase